MEARVARCQRKYIYEGHGDGAGWAAPAGVAHDTSPVVGAVAASTTGEYGHVAFITAVNGGTITVAEYNHDENGTFGTRTGTLSSLGFNAVAHFEKYERPSGRSDFNGDGVSDIFHANGARFDVSYGGSGKWHKLRSSAANANGLIATQ